MKMALRSLDPISRKTNFSRAARFFFYFLCRCFAPPQSPFVRLMRQTCRRCLTKIFFPVSVFAFIFSLPGARFHLATSISHFLTTAMKFSCVSSNEIRLPSSFSVIHESVNIKTNVEKDTTCWFFFLSKSPGGNAIFFRCIWVAMALDWVILYWCACGADWRSVARARADKGFIRPARAVYCHAITNFSRMGRFTQLWGSARPRVELCYYGFTEPRIL